MTSLVMGSRCFGSSSRRVRQHVNPLAKRFQQLIELPDWSQVFERPELPLHLDIGCARGKYLMQLAKDHGAQMNFLGVEIRELLVQEALVEVHARQLRNLWILHGNMHVQLAHLVNSLPSSIQSVSIFHPDPWRKKKQLKRRLVTPEFVHQMVQLLPENTPLYVQTDVEELFVDMEEIFEHFCEVKALDCNPFGIPTDREQFVVENALGAIYRREYRTPKRSSSGRDQSRVE